MTEKRKVKRRKAAKQSRSPQAERALARLERDMEQAEAAHREKLARAKDPARPELLNEIDPHGRYGKQTGKRYSTVVSSTQNRVARCETLGKRLREQLARDGAGGGEIILSPERARAIADYLTDFVPHLSRRLTYLEQQRAAARVVLRHWGRNHATRLRKALTFVVESESRGGRGRYFDAQEIVADYATLTRTRGLVTLWSDVERAFDLPGREVQCPIAPWDAICVLTVHHGFASQSACLRFLFRLRKAAEEAEIETAELYGIFRRKAEPARRSWLVELLRTLPPDQNR